MLVKLFNKSVSNPLTRTGMILVAEYGLHFAKSGDHWRCVEWPGLVMLRGGRYRVGELENESLAVAQEVAGHIYRIGRGPAI
jgi:hypothetical protein